MKARTLLLWLLVVGCVSVPYPRPSITHEETARTYVKLAFERLGQREVLLQAVPAIVDELVKRESGRHRGLSESEVNAFGRILVRWMQDVFSSSEFESGAAKILAQHLSESELQQLIDFWNAPGVPSQPSPTEVQVRFVAMQATPAGEKMMRAAPRIQSAFSSLGEELARSPKYEQRLMEELKKEFPGKM